MALTSTVHHFNVNLSHVDRGVYEALEFKAARHPSESPEYLATRVLAYCLEFGEGLAFSKGGLSDPDEPALSVRDLTGQRTAWIEVGLPDAARLHKAAKAAPRVAVYTHRDPDAWLAQLAGEKIHRADAIELHAFDRDFLAGFTRRIDRRTAFDLSVTDGHLYVTLGAETLEGAVRRMEVPAG